MISLTAQLVTVIVLAWTSSYLFFRSRDMMTQITQLKSAHAELSEKVSDILLTPEDRKLLGLPDRVIVEKVEVPVIVKGKDPKPSEMTPCSPHNYCAPFRDDVRRYENQPLEDDDGEAYVRVCLRCKWRQVRGSYIKPALDGSPIHTWHDD